MRSWKIAREKNALSGCRKCTVIRKGDLIYEDEKGLLCRFCAEEEGIKFPGWGDFADGRPSGEEYKVTYTIYIKTNLESKYDIEDLAWDTMIQQHIKPEITKII